MAESGNAVVVGEGLDEILGLAAFNEVPPDHFVFAVKPQVFFDGTAGPYPNSLLAEFVVDVLDGFLRFGHGGHHGVRFRCGNVAVLVDGNAVD